MPKWCEEKPKGRKRKFMFRKLFCGSMFDFELEFEQYHYFCIDKKKKIVAIAEQVGEQIWK